MDAARFRSRVDRFLQGLRAEDLEERIAPVKCDKHPDSPDCGGEDYAVPMYGDPTPEGGEGGGS